MASLQDWAKVQEAFALGCPVLVLGPGCHRAGYDSRHEWQTVVTRVAAVWQRVGAPVEIAGMPPMTDEDRELRRTFLERFWFEKLSDDLRASTTEAQADMGVDQSEEMSDDRESAFPDDQDIRDPALRVRPGEAARIALATDLLNALIDVTRMMGTLMEAGFVPVTDWQHLGEADHVVGIDISESRALEPWEGPPENARIESVPPEADGDSRPPDPIGEPAASPDHRVRAGRYHSHARLWLTQAATLAAALNTIAEGGDQRLPLVQQNALDGHGLQVKKDSDNFALLKVSAISTSLGGLIARRFSRDGGSVSGAVVEWLADLFWHVVTSGSGVPPSQAELDFYVNLVETAGTAERRHSRPLPGEYRGSSLDAGEALCRDIMELTQSYDSGFRREHARRDWSLPREHFARTIAASLRTSWRTTRNARPPWLVLALVTDFDMMLERALMEVLDEGEQFHVVVPARVVANDGDHFRWLFGTHTKGSTDRGRSLDRPEWQWFSSTKMALQGSVNGPIVIRLAGSPLYPLGAAEALGLEDADAGQELRPTVIYSEADSVRAVMALTGIIAGVGGEGIAPERSLGHDIFAGDSGLLWNQRSWLFFGQRFGDWIPRLRLLFTALWLARTTRKTNSAKAIRIAVDRQFNWPEQALLETLKISMTEADLKQVATYYAAETTYRRDADLEEPQRIKAFLEQVEETVGPSARSA